MGNEYSTRGKSQEYFRRKIASADGNVDWNLQDLMDEFEARYKNGRDSQICLPKATELVPWYVAGKGGFGVVWIVSYAVREPKVALKIYNKKRILKGDFKEMAIEEKNILYALKSPFICQLFYHFQDDSALYLVLEYMPGGELNDFLNVKGQFNEETTKFFVAQIAFALEYLQTFSICYRDLKPENVMLDSIGYLKLVDFGFAKVVKNRTYSFCGTPEYIAPEVIQNKGYTFYIDWWSLGIMTFEFLSGDTPFFSAKAMTVYKQILSAPMVPPKYISMEGQIFLLNILQRNPSNRLCCDGKGTAQLRNHPWFAGFNFLGVYEKKVTPPIMRDKINMDLLEAPNRIIKITNTYDEDFKDF